MKEDVNGIPEDFEPLNEIDIFSAMIATYHMSTAVAEQWGIDSDVAERAIVRGIIAAISHAIRPMHINQKNKMGEVINAIEEMSFRLGDVLKKAAEVGLTDDEMAEAIDDNYTYYIREGDLWEMFLPALMITFSLLVGEYRYGEDETIAAIKTNNGPEKYAMTVGARAISAFYYEDMDAEDDYDKVWPVFLLSGIKMMTNIAVMYTPPNIIVEELESYLSYRAGISEASTFAAFNMMTKTILNVQRMLMPAKQSPALKNELNTRLLHCLE